MNVLTFIAEFLGTFLLLTAIFVTGNWLAIGATLATVVIVTGNVSGGHANPAVSLALYLKGTLTQVEFGGYVLAQALGAAASLQAYKYFV